MGGPENADVCQYMRESVALWEKWEHARHAGPVCEDGHSQGPWDPHGANGLARYLGHVVRMPEERWERRLPSSIFNPNRVRTKIFNGYADQVADLYKGMNLARFY